MIQKLNLPNRLTISRILCVPLIVILLLFPGKWTCFLAGLLFASASLTDMVDGYLARKGNLVTPLGKFLDPLADKILISSVLIVLVQHGWVAGWVAVVIICRDVMITGMRAVAAEEGVVISADKYGKIKTAVQIFALEPLILHYSWLGIPMHGIGTVLLYVALALTVYSGGNYMYRFYQDWGKAKIFDSASRENGV